MKFYDSKGAETVVTWGDHWPGCERCRLVDLDKSATFATACATGSPLLMEELAKRQAPVESAKRKAIEDQARKSGVFVIGRTKNVATKYKE